MRARATLTSTTTAHVLIGNEYEPLTASDLAELRNAVTTHLIGLARRYGSPLEVEIVEFDGRGWHAMIDPGLPLPGEQAAPVAAADPVGAAPGSGTAPGSATPTTGEVAEETTVRPPEAPATGTTHLVDDATTASAHAVHSPHSARPTHPTEIPADGATTSDESTAAMPRPEASISEAGPGLISMPTHLGIDAAEVPSAPAAVAPTPPPVPAPAPAPAPGTTSAATSAATPTATEPGWSGAASQLSWPEHPGSPSSGVPSSATPSSADPSGIGDAPAVASPPPATSSPAPQWAAPPESETWADSTPSTLPPTGTPPVHEAPGNAATNTAAAQPQSAPEGGPTSPQHEPGDRFEAPAGRLAEEAPNPAPSPVPATLPAPSPAPAPAPSPAPAPAPFGASSEGWSSWNSTGQAHPPAETAPEAQPTSDWAPAGPQRETIHTATPQHEAPSPGAPQHDAPSHGVAPQHSRPVEQPDAARAAPAPAPAPDWPQHAPQQGLPGHPTDQPQGKRFPSRDDLMRSQPQAAPAPAQWGWRAALRSATFGAVKLDPGAAEQHHRDAIASVQRSLTGPKTIVVLNPKGGAHKTTATLMLGASFGYHRGGSTLAWDNNETMGTLGTRAATSHHDHTAVDLLRDIDHFNSVEHGRLGDLDNYVRGQGEARFDVLASDDDPHSGGMIAGDDFRRLHEMLTRYYRVLVIDTGNNTRAANWIAAVEAADQLVIVSTVRDDTAAVAAGLADRLDAIGMSEKLQRSVTVLSEPSQRRDKALGERLRRHFEQVSRSVVTVPYEPAFVGGGRFDIDLLHDRTREAWLEASAHIAEGLNW